MDIGKRDPTLWLEVSVLLDKFASCSMVSMCSFEAQLESEAAEETELMEKRSCWCKES